jgi:hypothetical protein
MKKFIAISALLLIAVGGWQLGASMSTDALGMALGIILGMMAGIPSALIAIVATKNNEQRIRHEYTHRVIAETPLVPLVPLVQQMTTFEPRARRVTVIDERNKLAAAINKRLEVMQ